MLIFGKVERLGNCVRHAWVLVHDAAACVAAKKLVPVRIIDVIFFSIHGEPVVDTEHFCLSELVLFILLLLQLLQLQVSTKPFHHDHLVAVVQNLAVCDRLERALLQLIHLLLSPFRSYPHLLFLQFLLQVL